MQDNYVVQWGDPNYDNPEADGETKPLPDGLKVMSEDEYATGPREVFSSANQFKRSFFNGGIAGGLAPEALPEEPVDADAMFMKDRYAAAAIIGRGWPLGLSIDQGVWPVHCYGMVGVGRGYSPDTGSGAELYTVIGHAPRHLDRNIALVGRIIEGMEYLSSLPRGHGVLGFYAEDEFEKRAPILSIDVAADLLEADDEPAGLTYAYEYLSTESETFAKYAEARANRRDPFFIHPAGSADICNIPVPIRPAPNG